MPDDEQKSEDKFGPEAIAARIEKMGEETEADRTAREEEQKLQQRRKNRRFEGSKLNCLRKKPANHPKPKPQKPVHLGPRT